MFIASLLTTIIAISFWLIALACLSSKENRLVAVLCFFATLPICFLAFHFVRTPIHHWLESLLGKGNSLFWISTFYAPVTEELAKLWPLILPYVYSGSRRIDWIVVAISLGVGFAVGEIFTVSNLNETQSPQVSNLPWYQLAGFINERLLTCFIHSGTTASAILILRKNGSVTRALAASMTLHYLANFPIALNACGLFGNDATVSNLILLFWFILCAVIGFLIIHANTVHSKPIGYLIYGYAICPSCKARYNRPLFKAINLGLSLRYEACTECRKWHWTKRTLDQEISD